MGKIQSIIMSIASMLSLVSCRTEQREIKAWGDVAIYKRFPEGGLPELNMVVDTIKNGEKCSILSEHYSKDFKYYKIETRNHFVGYVLCGDKFSVVK